MKTKLLLLLLLMSLSLQGFSTVWKVTYSGYKFVPDTVRINQGDSVKFELSAYHNAQEVSQRTWSENSHGLLTGGFEVPFGGGLVLPDKLTAGIHYYVCVPHAAYGMKGVIIVQSVTVITDEQFLSDIIVYPNPMTDILTIKTGSYSGDAFFISDQVGRQVLSGKLENETTTIDLSRLTKGIYFLRVGVKSSHHTLKVVKN